MQEVDATPITHVRIIIPLVHAMIEPESGVQIKHETQAAELRFMARVEQELFPLGSKRAPLLHVDDDVEWENNTFHVRKKFFFYFFLIRKKKDLDFPS
jgi:hypothetical protein